MHAAQMTPTCSRLWLPGVRGNVAGAADRGCRQSPFSREAIPTMELPKRHVASLYGQPARTTCRYSRRLTGAHGLLRGYRVVPLSTLSTGVKNAGEGRGALVLRFRRRRLIRAVEVPAAPRAHICATTGLSRRGNRPHHLRCDSRASASIHTGGCRFGPTDLALAGMRERRRVKVRVHSRAHSVRLPLTPSRAYSSPAPGSGWRLALASQTLCRHAPSRAAPASLTAFIRQL